MAKRSELPGREIEPETFQALLDNRVARAKEAIGERGSTFELMGREAILIARTLGSEALWSFFGDPVDAPVTGEDRFWIVRRTVKYGGKHGGDFLDPEYGHSHHKYARLKIFGLGVRDDGKIVTLQAYNPSKPDITYTQIATIDQVLSRSLTQNTNESEHDSQLRIRAAYNEWLQDVGRMIITHSTPGQQ